MKNSEIAEIFDRLADILEFKGEVVFKVNSYRKAARTLSDTTEDILDDVGCKRAKQLGVKVAIGTDAHRLEHMNMLRLDVAVARRGWLEPDDVINTLPLSRLRQKR